MSDLNPTPARVSSPARVEANRRNAQKSTGPKTPEGKAASRGNAVTHGLRCEVIEPENQRDLIDARADEWAADLRPADAPQAWLVRRAAAASVRLDLCMEAEIERRVSAADRAAAKYRELARHRASKLGERLSDAPGFVVEQFETTPAGCAWLVGMVVRKIQKLERPDASLDKHELRQALHGLGLDPDNLHHDPKHPVVGPFMRACLATNPNHDPAEADFWTGLDTSKLPSLEARRAEHAKVLPTRDEGRLHCRAVMAQRLADLEYLRDELEAIDEAPALARLRRCAALNSVGSKTSERLRRYESGHALDLHRSLNALSKLRRDAAERPEVTAPAPNEANELPAPEPQAPAPAQPGASRAPNEANDRTPVVEADDDFDAFDHPVRPILNRPPTSNDSPGRS